MPRKAKDKEKLIEEKNNKKTTTKKTTVAKKKTVNKKTIAKETITAKSTAKKTKSTKPAEKKSAAKKSTAKSSTSKKTKANKTTTKTSRTTKTKKIDVVEYYDLPYRYNETVVKILAQTPEILFVYWDISDEDKENYIKQYGEFFFNDTKPVLIVHNVTMNYSFEVDINDFANSWYLHINDSNCDYKVELGRRPINQYAKINDYLPISSSNEMDAPNDHILFDTLNDNVYFKNIKTNETYSKNISLSYLSKIGKIYNVKDFYKKMYKDENIDFERLNLKNMPSS